jgi:hypothetical protein
VIGPLAIGVWVAHVAFWLLLVIGIATRELSARRAGVFVALWLAGYVGLPFLFSLGPQLMTSYVAVLDIVLVFMVVKGDVRLS